MTAGETSPANTFIMVPALVNKGNAPLNFQVNQVIAYQVVLADKYNNFILEERSGDSVDFAAPFIS